jgi:hypothetical protein
MSSETTCLESTSPFTSPEGRFSQAQMSASESDREKILSFHSNVNYEEKTQYLQKRNHLIWKKIKSSFYFKSNVVYMIYSICMLLIDYSGWNLEIQNLNYLIFGLIHVCNAVMYLYVWMEAKQPIFTWFVLADWLNVFGALLYLISAFLYPYEYTSDDDNADYTIHFTAVRYLELFASLIEVIAAFGWNYQWYAVYIEEYQTTPETTIGRGLTLDDPDLWANITIDIGAIYYLYYNLSLFAMNFNNYDTNYIFVTGDIFYFINSVLYTIASLRDCDLFWYLPTAGIWPKYPPIILTIQREDPIKTREFFREDEDKDDEEQTKEVAGEKQKPVTEMS